MNEHFKTGFIKTAQDTHFDAFNIGKKNPTMIAHEDLNTPKGLSQMEKMKYHMRMLIQESKQKQKEPKRKNFLFIPPSAASAGVRG